MSHPLAFAANWLALQWDSYTYAVLHFAELHANIAQKYKSVEVSVHLQTEKALFYLPSVSTKHFSVAISMYR